MGKPETFWSLVWTAKVKSNVCSHLQTQEDTGPVLDSTRPRRTGGVCPAVDHHSLPTAAVGPDLGAGTLPHCSAAFSALTPTLDNRLHVPVDTVTTP